MEPVNPLQVLRDAMHIEKEGIRFYRLASKASKDRKTQELFMRLAGEEHNPLEKLELVYDNLAENNEWLVDKDLLEGKKKVLKDLDIFNRDIGQEGDMDALDRGIKVEDDSIILYQRAFDGFKESSNGRQSVFSWLLGFEKEHLKALKERRREIVGS
ncbi:MAG: ferritin family protein [Candidatus Altiarchaeota archaeon]